MQPNSRLPGQAQTTVDPSTVRRHFDRASKTFDSADFVHRAGFDGLMQRLSPIVRECRHIVDLGCATGSGSRALAQLHPRSTILSVDSSFGMLRQARRRKPQWSERLKNLTKAQNNPVQVQADAMALPFRDDSIDMLIASFLLPWLGDHPHFFTEARRVLATGGVLGFVTLGPDSLHELRGAWGNEAGHVFEFPDMHDIGDLLLRCGLTDPVLDSDPLEVTYRELPALYADLSASGARNCLKTRHSTMTGKRRFQAMEQRLLNDRGSDVVSLQLELVYGHAFAAPPASPSGETTISPAAIGRRRQR